MISDGHGRTSPSDAQVALELLDDKQNDKSKTKEKPKMVGPLEVVCFIRYFVYFHNLPIIVTKEDVLFAVTVIHYTDPIISLCEI